MRILIVTFIIFMGYKFFGQKSPEFSNITINSMGDIQWTVTYLQDISFAIHIEKFINGKWTFIDSGLAGVTLESRKPGKMETITHTNRVKFHKGTNVYRLVMTEPDKGMSGEIKLESNVSNDDGSLWIVDNKIILDEKVQYEILNSVGETLTKGEDKIVDISALSTGSYFLYTKTSTKSFTK